MRRIKNKLESNSNSPWCVKPEEIQKYNSFFDHFNKSGSGILSLEETKDAFMQTQLDDDTLEQIWGMVDTEEIGEFDRQMFCIAMHLLYKVKLGQKLPMTLPSILKTSVQAYFSGQMRPNMSGGGMQNQSNPQMNQSQPNPPMTQNPQMNQNRPTNQPMNNNFGGMDSSKFRSSPRKQKGRGRPLQHDPYTTYSRKRLQYFQKFCP